MSRHHGTRDTSDDVLGLGERILRLAFTLRWQCLNVDILESNLDRPLDFLSELVLVGAEVILGLNLLVTSADQLVVAVH